MERRRARYVSLNGITPGASKIYGYRDRQTGRLKKRATRLRESFWPPYSDWKVFERL